jgi:hypothetical protein
MNAPAWLIILISALTDLLIVSGSTLIGAMLATGEATLPTLAVWLVSGLSGLVAAGKEVRSSLKLPPAP